MISTEALDHNDRVIKQISELLAAYRDTIQHRNVSEYEIRTVLKKAEELAALIFTGKDAVNE